MPEEFVPDGSPADSSTGQQVVDPNPQVQPPNGGAPSPAQKSEPWDKSPRFHQLVREARDGRDALRQNQQLTQNIQQLQQQMQALQKTASGPAYTQEQRDERSKARQIIQELMNEDPEYAKERAEMAQIRAAFPHLLRGYQGVQALTQSQSDGNVRQGRQLISEIATKALPDNPKAAERVEDLVTGLLTRDEALYQRFRAGDHTAIQEAFAAVDADFISPLRRQATAQMATTKDQTRRLPPRSGGGLPTQAAPPKLDPDNPRAYMSALSKASQEVLGR